MELAELSGHLARAVSRFEEEEMGRRPSEVKVILEGELVLVHLKGVLSPSECDLARTDTGQAILQRFNTLLFNAGSTPSVKQQVSEAVCRQVLDVQTTLSPLTGSLVVIFTLSEAPGSRESAPGSVAAKEGG